MIPSSRPRPEPMYNPSSAASHPLGWGKEEPSDGTIEPQDTPNPSQEVSCLTLLDHEQPQVQLLQLIFFNRISHPLHRLPRIPHLLRLKPLIHCLFPSPLDRIPPHSLHMP